MTAPPNAQAMLLACEDAMRHRRRYQAGDAAIHMLVDDVPQVVPDMRSSGEWYRVGVLHLVTFDHRLTVYLDAVTGRVQVEQPLMQVARQFPPAAAPYRPEGPSDARARARWDNEGGAT